MSELWFESLPSIKLVLVLKSASSETDILDREKFLNGIQDLDLSEHNLGEVPDFIKDCTRLTSLDLSGNMISGRVDGSVFPSSLESLNLRNNEVEEFVIEGFTEVGLQRLRALHLGGNKLTEVPDKLDLLTKLTVLGLEKNNITSLKKETRYPNSGLSLNLSGNKLSEVSVGRAGLTRCLDLNFSDNELKTLPPQLIKGRLRFLDVSGNDIEDWNFFDAAVSKGVNVKLR